MKKKKKKGKHQIPSTCLRRSSFAPAGQITKKFQLAKIKSPHPLPLPSGEREGVRGSSKIEIWDLEFGISKDEINY
jgi:hypothetical protein